MKMKTAFTKKDLLVALFCIIFLLMNIAAVGSGGRKRAKEAVCFSNLRQWGIIFQSYTNDNNGAFMHGWNGATVTKNDFCWMGALETFFKEKTPEDPAQVKGQPNWDFACCPTASNRDTVRFSDKFATWGPLKSSPPVWNVPYDSYGSYGINDWVCDPIDNPANGYIVPMATWMGYPLDIYWRTPNIKNADSVPCFLDASYPQNWPHHNNVPKDTEESVWLEYNNMMDGFTLNRHNGAVNGLFVDGSVKRIGLKSLWYQKWHRYYDFSQVPPLDSEEWPDWMKDFE